MSAARNSSYRKTDKGRLYVVWYGMCARCHNPNHGSYKHYGQRGITVCAAWRNNVDAFRAWASSAGYQPGLQLDRTDNDAGYGPDNCKWVKISVQARNRRNNVKLTYNGKTRVALDWARDIGISDVALRQRLKRVWSAEDAVSRGNVLHDKDIEYNGRRMSLLAWSKQLGIPRSSLHSRLNRGWTVERAFSTPAGGGRRSLEFNGESMLASEWERRLGFSKLLISQRLRGGWSIEQALTTPAGAKRMVV